ncbi:MAG TPA: hypothetical protein VHZ26_03330 [Caulobacteraceae bacterium]|jgi:hypothetical protein|nr:hypothetical protein [Caulobacteraceae bacterium]
MALLVGAGGYAGAQTTTPWLHSTTTLGKTISETENINVTTNVGIAQTVTAVADDAAEASATANQTNQSNRDCGNCAEKLDVIENSSDSNTGLTSINQAAGNDNNQGTLVSAAIDTYVPSGPGGGGTPGDPGTQGFAHAQAEATQVNGGTGVGEDVAVNNDVEAVDLQFRTGTITNSVNGNNGLAFVNQATGNNDNQINELSVAFSERPSGVALAEADLGQFNTGNRVGEGDDGADPSAPIGIHKSAIITASMNDNVGVFGVNQSVGNNGNQANLVSVAAVGNNLPSF